jgi:hypothetical protein
MIIALLLVHLAVDVSAWLLGRDDSGPLVNRTHSYRYLRQRSDRVLKLSGSDSTVILSDEIGSFSFNINAPTDESKYPI